MSYSVNRGKVRKTRKSKQMSPEDFQGAVCALINDATYYIDNDIAPLREQAMAYYRGDKTGVLEAEEGRSQVVMTDGRDVIGRIQPSLLKIFASAEHAVSFQPRDESQVQQAQEQSDAVNYIFKTKNNGFRIFDTAFMDALKLKTGILTWWHEERVTPREYEEEGLTQEDIDALLIINDAELVWQEEESDEDDDGYPDSASADPLHPKTDMGRVDSIVEAMMGDEMDAEAPEDLDAPSATATYRIRYKRKVKDNLIKADCIPPEEYFITATATSETDAMCQGRRRLMSISDLVALGYDEDEIVEHAGAVSATGVSVRTLEAETRNPALMTARHSTSPDQSTRMVLYTESYVRVDKDLDGIAELRRVCTLGEDHYILHDEIWEEDEAPFGLLCPDPEPHMAIGDSIMDRTKDLQEIHSVLWRGTLDSLMGSLHPDIAVVEGQVNMDDVLNPELGKVMRMRQQGAIQEFAPTFVGQNAIPVFQALDEIRAQRTGVSTASAGADAESLQSTTALAVSTMNSANQESIEMIARRFAESGIKRMFVGILRLIKRHIREPLDITTADGSMTKIDPRRWTPDLDVSVNVGLGRGNSDQQSAALAQLFTVQQTVLSAMGLDNPFFGPMEVRNTLAKILENSRIQDVSKYIKRVDPNWKPAEKPQQSDPNMLMAQIEHAKIKADSDMAMLKYQAEMAKIASNERLELQKLADERALKVLELQVTTGVQINAAQVDADIQHAKMAMAQDQADLDRVHAGLQADADREHQGQMKSSDQDAAMMSQAMAQQAQAQQAQAEPQTPPNAGF